MGTAVSLTGLVLIIVDLIYAIDVIENIGSHIFTILLFFFMGIALLNIGIKMRK